MRLDESLVLNNGIKMPVLGLGVYKSGENTKQAVLDALEAGYRHIDVASVYGNENEVGQAIRESGIPREEIFVTTKLWNDDMRAGIQKEAFEKSLERLQMDYVDLYLLHWPVAEHYLPSWHILENLNREGRAKSIGVSNFQMGHLMDLMAHATVVPVVNQIECHPYLSQQPLCSFCRKTGIQVTAWAPLGRAKVFEDAVIKGLAEKYGQTPAQVILRWELQRGIIVIPKSVHRERIIENSKIFDFELVPEDMAVMDGLNKDQRFGPSPDTFDF
ncbi:aldo/keto reductase [Frisingicoccus sp.]|uniref:aldo/keto reductase n=1 Tax=Frisingicoccus sp. TaxID=1918627 RepID=UPI003AB7AC47